MASRSSRMRRFECVTTESRKTSPECFVDKTVTALRLQLETRLAATNSFMLLYILSLSVAEAYTHNYKAAATHLLLISRLAAQMAGLKPSTQFFRSWSLLAISICPSHNICKRPNTFGISRKVRPEILSRSSCADQEYSMECSLSKAFHYTLRLSLSLKNAVESHRITHTHPWSGRAC